MSGNLRTERQKQKEHFNGPYCVVIIPDTITAERARTLARQLAPNAEFRTEIPHITLFQGQVRDLPLGEVKKLLKQLVVLRGKSLDLDKLEVFADQYVFWNVKNTTELQEAHEQALQLAKYVDPEKLKLMPHQGLKLTEQQLQDAQKYGFPLSGSSYLPHITLAADSDSLSLPSGVTEIQHQMTVVECRFGELGKNGRVENLIEIG